LRVSAALPPAGGSAVGLFGGSFNPPHEGHVAASLHALRRCGLDRVWWLVTPGNPLKPANGLPSVEDRIAAARAITDDPRIVPTDIEARLGTRYTADLVRVLLAAAPETRFVLVIGADNWADFHRWHDWHGIVSALPIAVVDRPGATYRALAGRAASVFSEARLPENRAAELAHLPAPAWCFLNGLRNPLSSTWLRSKAPT
jgi:nicotinate-nucleotide adenylyltransferase